MPIIPCDNKITCDCNDSPFVNLSSEAPDQPSFFSIGYAYATPPLGYTFDRTNCAALCESVTSQEAANLCAYLAALQCVTTDWTTPGDGSAATPVPPAVSPRGNGHAPFFLNTQQEGTANCADGLPFTYTVPAGVYGGLSQSQADEAAASAALSLAQIHLLCLSNIQNSVCVDTAYNATITASSQFLARPPGVDVWRIDGELPPGITIPEFISTTGLVSGGVIHLQGTPTVPGTYNFTISIFLANGDSFSKPYTLNVAGITNGLALPDGKQGTAYSADVFSAGVTNPIFSLESGALPDGLSLDPGGIIFGTPTVADDFHFVLGMTEAGTGVTCNSPAAITVTGGFNWNDVVFGILPDPQVVGFVVTTTPASQIKIDASAYTGGPIGVFPFGQYISKGTIGNGSFSYEGPPIAGNFHVVVGPNVLQGEIRYWDNGVPGIDPPQLDQLLAGGDGTIDFPITITGGPGGSVSFDLYLTSASLVATPGQSIEVTLTPAS